MAGLWNIGFDICWAVWFRYGIQGTAVIYFSPFNPPVIPSSSLGFFSLILQHIRPLIYSADIARKPKHPAKSVDSAIVRRSAVRLTNTFSISQDESEQSHAHAWTVIRQTFSISELSTGRRRDLPTWLSKPRKLFFLFKKYFGKLFKKLWRVYPSLDNDSVNHSGEAYTCNRRTPIDRQRTNKHASLIVEAMFSVWFLSRG